MRRMGRVHGVREQHGRVLAQGIQELCIALDESLLLLFVELTRNDIRLGIFDPRRCNNPISYERLSQTRPKSLLDPGTDRTREARQRWPTKTFNAFYCAALKKLPPMLSVLWARSYIVQRVCAGFEVLSFNNFNNNASAAPKSTEAFARRLK